jgi:hypothetical protein
MSRQNRIALLIAAVLVVAVSGTVLATRQGPTGGAPAAPAASGDDDGDGLSDASDVAHAAERLAAHGITVDEAQLNDLAGRYGVGGAVRLMAWAEETGMTVEDIAAMRDGDGTPETVMGWGQIAHELGVHPGIGSIMGNGGGGGRDAAPGQQDDTGDEGDASGG